MLRNFKSEDSIYRYLAELCDVYFPIGSLLKDYDFSNDNTIESPYLEKILFKAAPELTQGDIQFLVKQLDEGNGKIDSKEFLANINYYIRDRTKRQKLESRIPNKLINPLDETEK